MNIASLSSKHCQACTTNTPLLSQAEIAHYLTLFPAWQLKEGRLERQFLLKNFQEALILANRIGEIADKENHHPNLLVSWGCLGITIFTHAVNGLTENDFILTARIEKIIA